jgi:hypothetical protein
MPYIKSEDRNKRDLFGKAKEIAWAVVKTADGGPFSGDLNYAITTAIDQLLWELNQGKINYDMQATIFGVLLDVALEFKSRVNTAYEVHKLVENGDCYGSRYRSKPVEVVDDDGNHIGYIYVNVDSNDGFNANNPNIHNRKLVLTRKTDE